MDTAPTLETVMDALNALYHGENPDGKEKASLWLGELQKSTFAWQISDQLLLLNHSVESCYFAAQTMRSKIQTAFHELPESSHESLKNSLMSHCTKISLDTLPVIVTQLCLALADLALQMVAWDNAAIDLINQFAASESNWIFLLEVLSVLPEEAESRSLRLSLSRIKEVLDHLKQASPLLLQFLNAVLNEKKNDLYLRHVLHCLSSWINFLSITPAFIISNNILQLPLYVLQNDESPISLHKAATDCLCSALMSLDKLRDASRGREEEEQIFSRLLFDAVCSLSSSYVNTCQRSTEVDVNKLMNFSRIFTDACETFMEYFIVSPNEGFGDFRLLELLLSCVDNENFEIADVTFTFWNKFSENVFDARNEKLNDLLRPYIARLIEALRKHTRLDPSHETLQDCPDDFLDFRYQCHDLVTDVGFIVGQEKIFMEMFERLKESGDSWRESESCLFMMCAVARHSSGFESNVVMSVLDLVLSINDVHHCIRQTCIKLVGELRNWIDGHPQYIEPSLNYLLVGLQSKSLAGSASESIECLCLCSPEHMVPLFDQLLPILESIGRSYVSNDAVLGILKGCASILGRMSSAEISQKIRLLCSLQLVPLDHILESEMKVVIGCKENDPVVWLDRLSAIFSHMNPTVNNGDVHPCQETVQQVWLVLVKVFTKYSCETRIIERSCRCLRFAIRCLAQYSTFLVEPTINQMISLYKIFPHSCCLYLGSILVDEFGAEASCRGFLIGMLEAFAPPTFKLLNETSGLRNHPDIVDDLFRLCLRFVQKSPQSFLQCGIINLFVNFAAQSFCLDHKDGNESACKFIIEFLKEANKQQVSEVSQLMHSIIRDHGQNIMNHIIKASLYCLPQSMVPQVSEVLYELFLYDAQASSHWLEQTLKALPTHTTSGKETANQQQLADFHKNISSSHDWKSVYRGVQGFIKLFR